MRTLDNQGRALAQIDSLQLAHLLELIESAIELVDGCNKAGTVSACLLPQLCCMSSNLCAKRMPNGCCWCCCCWCMLHVHGLCIDRSHQQPVDNVSQVCSAMQATQSHDH